jgi:hypothetical protein
MATNLRSATERTKPSRVAKQAARKLDQPSEERIRVLAYQLYERRQADGASGDAATDWIEAERLLANGEN